MELVKDRISIITPCYNAEEFIQRYIDNIIKQTYSDIELILINDGSTDSTEKIILENKNKLEQRLLFKYFSYKENKGQAFALNIGLTQFSGEFITTMMDCDDIYMPDCVEKKVKLLKENPEITFCTSLIHSVNIENPDKILFTYFANKKIPKYVFWKILSLKFFPMHCIMRSKQLLESLDNKKICTYRAGQNLQILLPISYRKIFGFIQEPLSKYVQHKNSHSHSIKNYYQHQSEICKIIDYTLSLMNIREKDRAKANNILQAMRKKNVKQTFIYYKRKIIPFNIRNEATKIFNKILGLTYDANK